MVAIAAYAVILAVILVPFWFLARWWFSWFLSWLPTAMANPWEGAFMLAWMWVGYTFVATMISITTKRRGR